VRDGCCDCFQDARAVGHDLVIVEAQNTKPFAGKEGVSAGIALLMLRFEVLAAVNLDGETRGIADEIHDVGTDWCLATKARALHMVAAQRGPHQPFGIGRVLSERARSRELLRRYTPSGRLRCVSQD
jgi:hypothetical protein